MIISNSNKFIFFKPMKTAGTSIEYALSLRYPFTGDDICTGNTENNTLYGDWARNMENHYKLSKGRGEHFGPEQLCNYFPMINLGLYKKYTIVRNPWDMMVSYYWYIHDLHTRYSFDPDCEPLENDDFYTIKRKFNLWMQRKYITRIFKDDNPGLEQPFQTVARINEPMASIADQYIRFENLQEDAKNNFGIPFSLPHFKSGLKRIKRNYRDYYEANSYLVREIKNHFPNTIFKGKYIF